MRKILVILLSFLSFAAYSQTNTFSPYSRYGLGELSREGLTLNKGMGGTGIALRVPNMINYLNPASYTVQDTLSFIFDFGLYANRTNYKTGDLSSRDLKASLDHIVIGFPITKWWKSSMGLVPYSKMGYDIVNYDNVGADIYSYKYTYQGTGGLNKYYFGNAIKLKDLSLGVNFNVVFGSLEQTNNYSYEKPSATTVFPTNRYQQQTIRSTSFTFGAQYNIKLNDDLNLVVGGTFENPSHLVSKNLLLVTNRLTVTDSIINPYTGKANGTFTILDTVNYVNHKVTGHIPMKYGVGLSVNYKNKLLVSADYSTQKWSDYTSFNPFDSLTDSKYLNVGLQFTPDEKAIRSYWKRINIRAGFYTNDTYLNIGGKQIKDVGVSFGLRFPLKGNRSAIQLSYEYGKLGTTDFNLVQENYNLVNLSISLFDFWFVKSKFD